MDYEQEIKYIQELWSEKPRVATQILKKQNVDLYDIIAQNPGGSFSSKAWLFVNKFKCIPKCECGSNLKYLDYGRGYTVYCSKKCTATSDIVKKKKRITITKKYGVPHFSKTAEFKSKFKKTMQSRHQVDNPGQIEKNKKQRARNKQETFYNNLFLLEESEPAFSFLDYTHVRDKELTWKCKKCNVLFQSNIFSKLPKCPDCYPPGNFGGQSSVEKEIIQAIRGFYSGTIIENDRTIIAPKEIDIFIPEFNLAIEVNGLYWHSDKFLDKNYHSMKYNLLTEKKINMLMLTDYEWSNNKELILHMIKHRLQLTTNKVHGRKCTVRKITVLLARKFHNQNHIHGFVNSSEHFGLYHNGEIVSVLSLRSSGRFEQNIAEITRLSFAANAHGALGKFLSFIKNNCPGVSTIISYADLRYGSGNVYLKNNFKFVHTTNPGFWYYKDGKMYHRMSWQKHKLVKMGYDSEKTAFAIMDELGALRIYDAGHNKYKLEI